MKITDYHPTGREMEVLQFVKQEPTQEASAEHVYTKIGATEYVLDKTLDNLVMTGHLSKDHSGVYVFNHDFMPTA